MRRYFRAVLAASLILPSSAPATARDSLGMFARWGAFRDPAVPRCYAIAQPSRDKRASAEPYANIGWWPRRGISGQVHFRLSRPVSAKVPVVVAIQGSRWTLKGAGTDFWAADRRDEAAIRAAIRSARSLSVGATDTARRRFANTYSLDGAATAMDAATLACARTA